VRAAALATAAAVAAAAGLAGEAGASELIDRNAARASLSVNGAGHALVAYSRGGSVRRVHAWGAINARPPTRGVPQVSFRLDYSGRGFSGGTCLRYDGPPLAWLVRACKAPDGSYWALQSWQRLRANQGGASGPWELRLSHWRGELPRLELKSDWAYRRFDHLYGLFTYQGKGVYGFRTTRGGVPLDGYGRNVYVDTLGSGYGAGWRRENSFVSQRPNGSFCYGFYPRGGRVGKGTRYRATVIGPGVAPDVMWEGPAPGPYDPAREQAANAEQRQLFAGNRTCRPL
jgi:hypothetical protein